MAASFTQVIESITANQHDMVELLSKWESLLSTTSADVTFTLFDSTTYVVPNITKVIAQYGANSVYPVSPSDGTIVKRTTGGIGYFTGLQLRTLGNFPSTGALTLIDSTGMYNLSSGLVPLCLLQAPTGTSGTMILSDATAANYNIQTNQDISIYTGSVLKTTIDSNGFYEKGRTTRLGEWDTCLGVICTGGTIGASNIFKFAQVGKTVFVHAYFTITMSPAAPNLYFSSTNLPLHPGTFVTPGSVFTNDINQVPIKVTAYNAVSVTSIAIQSIDGVSNLPVNMSLGFSLTYEIA